MCITVSQVGKFDERSGGITLETRVQFNGGATRLKQSIDTKIVLGVVEVQ